MTVLRSRSTPIARIVSAVLAAAVAPAAMAQDAVGLEEVLVTATRAGITNLQQTPVSVSAVTAEDIDRMVARDISGIATSVPGFSASRITAFNAASFAMRGVGLTDIIVYQDSPVGVTMDDFVLPSVQTQLLDTFDIESVEVLRGPQGTLFGKNTTGGAVNIRSKRPDMDEMGADFRLGYGSFNAVRAQGSIDVPVIEDVLALRFVGAYSKSDGYYKLGADYGPINTLNIFGGTFAPFTIPGVTGTTGAGSPNKSSGGDDNLNGRIKARWNVNDDLTFLAQYEIMRDRSDAVPAYNDTPPNGPYLWNVLGFTRPNGDPLDNVGSTQRQDSLLKMGSGQVIDVDGIYLNMEWDVGYGTIYANAGKRTQDEHLPNTYTGAAPVNQATGEVISLFDATRDTTRDTTQFEARFASDFDGSVNFVAGVFQQTNDAEFCVVQVLGFIDLAFDLGSIGAPQQLNNSTPQVLCNKQDSDSLAGYVDATWEITDQFSLAGGYRMTRDERSWTGRTQVGFDILDDNLNNGSLSWQDFSDPLQAGNFNRYPGGIIVNENTPGFAQPVGDLDRAELAHRRFVQVHRQAVRLRDDLGRLQGRRLQRPDRHQRPDGFGADPPGRSRIRDELRDRHEVGKRGQPLPLQPDRVLHHVQGRPARGEHHHREERRPVPGNGVLQRRRGRGEGHRTRVPGCAHGQLPYPCAGVVPGRVLQRVHHQPARPLRPGFGWRYPAFQRGLLGPARAAFA